MADKEEVEESASRGNEWEVVSLTASTYAASPGPTDIKSKDDEKDDTYGDPETSHALFMSSHFVFPPNEHENLPLEPDSTEIHKDHVSKDVVSELDVVQEGGSNVKEEEDWNLKGLNVPDEFSGMQLFDGKNSKEQSIYGAATFDSLHSETILGGSAVYDEKTAISERTESSGGGLDFPADVLPVSEPAQNEKNAEANLPCEAWWRRSAASFYAHAKEANAFWSIFIAAAFMGLVILGQRWQQERWQVLQLRWQTSLNDEKAGKMLGSITRLKDVIVGGHRRGSLIRGSSSSES